MNNDIAPIEHTVPELPHLITFIYRYFQGAEWASFLNDWDSVFFSFFIATAIALIFHLGLRHPKTVPTGLQNFLESMAEGIRGLVHSILGKDGDKYIPFLGTLFVYIFCMNIAGMIPLMKSPSTSIDITAGMAIIVFVYVQYLNIRNMGLFGFLYHLAGSPKTMIDWLIVPLMFPIELLIQISRPVTLALRLFGNILGEDILIAAFAVFGIALMATWQIPVGLPLQLPFMFLGVLTSLMQAMVFTLLSAVYIMLSMPHGDESH